MEIKYKDADLLLGKFKCSFIEANAYTCLFSKKVYENKAAADVLIKIRYINDENWNIVVSLASANILYLGREYKDVNAVVIKESFKDGYCKAELVAFIPKKPLKITEPHRLIVGDHVLVLERINFKKEV